jgi:AP-3 complex subunit beta
LLPAQAKKPSAGKKKAPAKREAKKGGKKKSGFYSSEEEEESSEEEEEDSEGSTDDDDLVPKLQDDHALLLRVCLPLLRSRNSGVVLAVAALHHYVGPRDRAVLGRIGRALVRVMRGHREVTYVVLTNCVEFARAQPDMFRRYLKDFFIAVRARRLPLRLLLLLRRLLRAGTGGAGFA